MSSSSDTDTDKGDLFMEQRSQQKNTILFDQPEQ